MNQNIHSPGTTDKLRNRTEVDLRDSGKRYRTHTDGRAAEADVRGLHGKEVKSKSIRNVSIRTKLITIFTFVIVLMGIVGWYVISGMHEINDQLNSIYYDQVIPARVISDANIALLAWNRSGLHYVLSGSTEKKEVYEEIILHQKVTAIKLLDDLSKVKNLTERENDLLRKLLNNIQREEAMKDRVITLSQDGKQKEGRGLIRTGLRPIVDEMEQDMAEFQLLRSNNLVEKKKNTDHRYWQGFIQITLIGGGTIFLAIFAIFLFYRAILNNVNELVRGMKSLSEGSFLPAKVNILSKEELGFLCDVYNRMVDAITQNIADMKQSDAEIRKLNEELKDHIKESESFSYSVSHDLRALLRHIDGFADLLMKNTSHLLDEKSRRHLTMMSESAKKMDELIDAILHFLRIGRSEMKRGTVNLEQLVREAQRDLAWEADGSNIGWEVNALPEVYGDRSMLKLVRVNFLSNALKFTARELRPGSRSDALAVNRMRRCSLSVTTAWGLI